MEAFDEVPGPNPNKDHTHIVKGKRTKRQRPHSPIPFTIAAHSSSGDGVSATNNNHNIVSDSPASSAELVESATEEEEGMANCLILLAQGHSLDQSRKPNGDEIDEIGFKFTSKRLVEGNGKAGMYVYQCKTCNRTFPSFQALGGHRASHKKPKLALAAEKRPMMSFSDEEEEQFKNPVSLSPLSLQWMHNRGSSYGNFSKSSPKVHECSICGAEFTSGQALGGHMRRHRAAPVGGATTTATTNTTLSLSPTGHETEDQEAKKQKNVLSLDLDLNLPAPEDDHKDSKFGFASKQRQQQQQKQQQSHLVMSTAPALVDCHY